MALLLLTLCSIVGFVSADSNYCGITEAQESLNLAIQVLDLVKDKCKETIVVPEEVKTQESCKLKPSNCAELMGLGFNTSGVYRIYPKWTKKIQPFDVYCDQETDGGGWTVFQRRGDYGEPKENFFRNWTDYRIGFGNLKQEFWLGNDFISALTTQDRMQLRVDLEDFEKNRRFALYDNFLVLDETKSYKMTLSEYHGNAGDALTRPNGQNFSTVDRDINSCAKTYKGGWWYDNCHVANLNGLYLKGKHETYADGVDWEPFRGYHYSLKISEMKLRPQFYETDFAICLPTEIKPSEPFKK